MRSTALLFLMIMIASSGSIPKAIGGFSHTMDCAMEYDLLTKQRVYIIVDKMPEYPGGNDALLKYFSSNYKQQPSSELQSRFNLEFIIDSKGNILGERIKTSKKNITKADKEALRVLKNMPKWRPGKCGSQNVSVKMHIPVTICFAEE